MFLKWKKPEWYRLLRWELRPTGERIKRLESIRTKYEIPEDIFANGLASYPSTTRLLQINLYKEGKKKWPSAPECHLLKSILGGRALKPEPDGYGMTPEQFEEVMTGIGSLEELCDYVVSKDSEKPGPEFDLAQWERDIDMLKEADIDPEWDWERHRRNVQRMQRDNVKEQINAIMKEEAQQALAEIRDMDR